MARSQPQTPTGRLAWLRAMGDRERVGLIVFILVVGSLLIQFVGDWRDAAGTAVLVALTFAGSRLFYLGRGERLRTPSNPPPAQQPARRQAPRQQPDRRRRR